MSQLAFRMKYNLYHDMLMNSGVLINDYYHLMLENASIIFDDSWMYEIRGISIHKDMVNRSKNSSSDYDYILLSLKNTGSCILYKCGLALTEKEGCICPECGHAVPVEAEDEYCLHCHHASYDEIMHYSDSHRARIG